MPKKKSGKKDKLANMTDGERLIYMEQQRLQEEEKRKQKEDALLNILKNKVAHEEKTTLLNMNKLNHQWRNIMREAKSKELKKEIEILSQTFERIIDRKESIIKSLAKDLFEAEEQYATAFRHHIQNIDLFIGLQNERLETLRSEFERELEIIRVEFDSELDLIERMHAKEMQDLDDVLFAMEMEFNERDEWMKSEYQSARDEIKNKSLEEKHAMRVNLEFAVDSIWSQFQQALKNYEEATSKRKKQFEELRNKDKDSAKTIEVQTQRLQKLSDQIAQLKSKMTQASKENDERNKQIKEEKDQVARHFQDVKAQLTKLRLVNRNNLGKLTIESHETIKHLKVLNEKGEKILRLAELCRKLETEEEKVLPFYVSSLTEEEEGDVEQAVVEKAREPLADVLQQYLPLDNFWKRFNKVNLEKLGMEKEQQLLNEENQQLRKLLKQYLDGISVHDEVLSQRNPLFVVNQRTKLPAIPVAESRVTAYPKVVIEAATHVKYLNLPQ